MTNLGQVKSGTMFRIPIHRVIMMKTTAVDDKGLVGVVGLKHGTFSWWPGDYAINTIEPIGFAGAE